MPSEKRARQRAGRDAKLAVIDRQRRRRKTGRRAVGAVVVAGVVIGLVVALSNHTTTPPVPLNTAIKPVCPPSGGASARHLKWKTAPPVCVSSNATYDATVKTDVGTFVISMPVKTSPLAVNDFVFLARNRFYNTTVFHRVIPGFAVQGGDPTGTGEGGPGYSFDGKGTPPASCQATKDCYKLGEVALANSGATSSDGSQFFIVVGSAGEQLPPSYSVLGQVVSGMSVVQHIARDGNSDPSANGVPPKIKHHIISVTISQTH